MEIRQSVELHEYGTVPGTDDAKEEITTRGNKSYGKDENVLEIQRKLAYSTPATVIPQARDACLLGSLIISMPIN